MTSLYPLRLALLSSVCALSALATDRAAAQSSSTQSGAQNLPPVVISEPNQLRRRATTAPARTQRATRSTVRPRAAQAPRDTSVFVRGAGAQSAFQHVDGYVAQSASTGMKSDVPIMQTPASISVVTSDQIRDQGAQSINEALRYTAGVRTEVSGSQAMDNSLALRGFLQSNFRHLPGRSAQRHARLFRLLRA